MLKTKKTFLISMTIVAAFAFSLPAFAKEEIASEGSTPASEEKDWSIELSDTFMSKYLWRGLRLNDDWVMQPSVGFTYKWITLNVWSNFDLTDSNTYPEGSGENKFTEIDYTFDFTYEFESFGFSLGYIYYDFPNTGYDATAEAYGSVTLNVPLSPTVAVYFDTMEVDGVYGVFKIGHTFEEVFKSGSMSLSIDLSGGIGAADDNHNKFYYGVDDVAYTDAFATLALPIAIGDHFTVTPTGMYSILVDKEIRDVFEDESSFCGGATLAISF